MTNKPIFKNKKMNITQLTTCNYINTPPVGKKKTNPFSPSFSRDTPTDSLKGEYSIILHKKMENKPKVKFCRIDKLLKSKHLCAWTLSWMRKQTQFKANFNLTQTAANCKTGPK